MPRPPGGAFFSSGSTHFGFWRGCAHVKERNRRSEPTLTIHTGRGLRRVFVNYDQGDEKAGFALLRRTLSALRQLDRALRRSGDRPSGAPRR